MARGPSKRVVLHRATLDAVTLGMADGLFALAKAVVLDASPMMADSPMMPYPEGEGLPKQGGALAYVSGGKVAGWHIRGMQPKKPKAVRADARHNTVLVVGGYGFPARLNEFGTVNTMAHPALTPALAGRIDEVADFVGNPVRLRLARIL